MSYISEFNSIPRPRQVKISLGKIKNETSVIILLFVLILIFVVTATPIVFVSYNDYQSLQIKKTGVKATAVIEEIKRIHSGRFTSNVATFRYEYKGVAYRNTGVIRFRSKNVGDYSTVYFPESNPAQSEAEFTLGEVSDIQHEFMWQLIRIFSPWFCLVSLGVYMLIIRPRKFLKNGLMVEAKVLETRGGRYPSLVAEYSPIGHTLISRNFSNSGRQFNVGDIISVVYLPDQPTKAIVYPSKYSILVC